MIAAHLIFDAIGITLIWATYRAAKVNRERLALLLCPVGAIGLVWLSRVVLFSSPHLRYSPTTAADTVSGAIFLAVLLMPFGVWAHFAGKRDLERRMGFRPWPNEISGFTPANAERSARFTANGWTQQADGSWKRLRPRP